MTSELVKEENMKKEQILELSKKENKNKDIFIMQVDSKGTTYAVISMLILAFIFYIYEMKSGKGTNLAFYSIITCYNAILYGYRAIKIKEKRKLTIFTSAVWSILTIIFILEYFKVL